MRKILFLLAVFTLATLTAVATTVPMHLSHQGRLTDSGGNEVSDGSYSLTFRLYEDSTGGTPLWSSGVQQVTVTSGLYVYALGKNVFLPHSLFSANPDLWLGITIGADPEISPRTQLSASPSAAVAASVSGDITTSRGTLIIDDDSGGGDSSIVVEGQVSGLDHHGHVTILKIANGGTDTTELVGMIGDSDSPRMFVGDDGGLDSGVVVVTASEKHKHRGHVTILKISNGGLDTSEVIELAGDPELPSINVGDDGGLDSGIVVVTASDKYKHRGHVTILKISNGGTDTSEVIKLSGDPDLPSINVGDDGGLDSGIVVVTASDKYKHRGHVTILKISNGGTDTSEVIELAGDPELPSINVGDDGGLDSGIVVVTASDKYKHRGHVTILKISNGGTDTTSLIEMAGDPGSPQLIVGDGDDSDSGVVVLTASDKHKHRGHVTILKISNGGTDTTSLIEMSGAPDSPQLVVGEGDAPDSSVVVLAASEKHKHHGHVTILKIANGGADTTDIVSVAADADTASIQLSGGGGSGGSVYMRADAGTGSGTVAINNPSPAYELDVVGTMCATGGMCQQSDIRLKENIEPLAESLSLIRALEPIRYNWRTNEFPERQFSDNAQVGFIAQDVLQILPEVVSQGSDGYYSLDYAKLTPLLVAAVKEQDSVIENQSEDIKALEAEVARLSKLVTKLAESVDLKSETKFGSK